MIVYHAGLIVNENHHIWLHVVCGSIRLYLWMLARMLASVAGLLLYELRPNTWRTHVPTDTNALHLSRPKTQPLLQSLHATRVTLYLNSVLMGPVGTHFLELRIRNSYETFFFKLQLSIYDVALVHVCNTRLTMFISFGSHATCLFLGSGLAGVFLRCFYFVRSV